MKLQIHCPHCAASLAVPEDAGGRKGRCPQCRNTFRVPDAQSMLEDSVTCWLEQAEEPETNDLFDQGDSAPKAAKPDKPSKPVAESIASHRNDAPPPEKPATPKPAKPKKQKSSRVSLGSGGSYQVRSAIRAGVKPQVDPEEERYREKPKPVPPKPKPSDRSADRHSEGRDGVFLEVVGVSAAGVTFSFRSDLMNRAAFRASMPMSCILCSTTEPGSLVARPLGWIDKATGKKADPGQIETTYEVEVKVHQTAREVTDVIRPIDELNPPFNQPLPYYICHECAPKVSHVHAEAMSVPTGVVCEVQIPASLYALQWLGRVNGVCGDAYASLESQVLAYSDEQWRSVDDTVRQRLTAWFDFQPDEQYLGYLSDSDFAKKDAGLAGIVVTDARIVYCKYHHHGEVSLTDPAATLVATADGSFHDLTYQHDGKRRKLIRIRKNQADQLIELLRTAEAEIEFEMRG